MGYFSDLDLQMQEAAAEGADLESLNASYSKASLHWERLIWTLPYHDRTRDKQLEVAMNEALAARDAYLDAEAATIRAGHTIPDH